MSEYTDNSHIEESKYGSRSSDDEGVELIHGQTLKGNPGERREGKEKESQRRMFSQNSDIVEEEEMSESCYENNDPDLGPTEGTVAQKVIPASTKLPSAGKLKSKGRETHNEMGTLFKEEVLPNYPSVNKSKQNQNSNII